MHARLPPPIWVLTGRAAEGAAYGGRGKGRGSPRLGEGWGLTRQTVVNRNIFYKKYQSTTLTSIKSEKVRKNLKKSENLLFFHEFINV